MGQPLIGDLALTEECEQQQTTKFPHLGHRCIVSELAGRRAVTENRDATVDIKVDIRDGLEVIDAEVIDEPFLPCPPSGETLDGSPRNSSS